MLHSFLSRHSTWFEEYAVICPVPSFLGPGARRRFGHVELVCAEVAHMAGGEWPAEPLLSKVVETEPMTGKAHPVRKTIGRALLAHAFRPAPGATIAGRHVVVVDDVCASGETLLAAARALRSAGADEVAGLVLARASWHGPPSAKLAARR